MKLSRSRASRVGRNLPSSRSIYWGLWNPTALFKFGEQGLWYDPSDLTDAKLNWRRNFLLYSEQFESTNWSKVNATVTPNVTAAPDGTMTADKLVENATLNSHAITQSTNSAGFATVTGQMYTGSVRLKKAERGFAFVGFNGGGILYFISVDLTTGAASVVSAQTGCTYQVNALANGWWEIGVTVTALNATGMPLDIRSSPDGLWANRVYTGDGTSGIYVWGGQVALGTDMVYQRITDFNSDFLLAFPLHTLFQDNFGVTAITGVEQTTGLILDKGQGGARGTEMLSAASVGGPFAAVGDWTTTAGNTALSVVGGELVCTVSGTGSTWAAKSAILALTAGVTYEIILNARVSDAMATGSGVRLTMYNLTAGTTSYSGSPNNSTNSAPLRAVFTPATSGNYYIIADRGSAGAGDNSKAVIVQSATIKRVMGNHASQTTTPSRPIWSARVNKCLNYNANPVDLTGTAFTNATNALATATIIDDTAALAAAGLSGLATTGKVYRIDNSAGNSSAYLVASGSVGNVNQHTVSAYGRLISGSLVRVELQGGAGGTTSANPAYTRLSTTVTPDTIARGLVMLVPAGAIGHFILNQLEEGTAPSRVQMVTGSTYDATGWPRYLKFDGIDDWLQTVGSVDMTGGDKLSVFVGEKKSVDGAQGVLVEFSASSGANGTWAMFAPLGSSSVYGSRSLGTTDCLLSTTPTNYPALRGIPDALTLLGDISAPRQTLRVNGAQYQTTATQGNGNYANQPIYIGRRGGASQPFAGNLYGVIVRAAASNDAQIASAERFINKQMGLAA